jgi:hypothetical protein
MRERREKANMEAWARKKGIGLPENRASTEPSIPPIIRVESANKLFMHGPSLLALPEDEEREALERFAEAVAKLPPKEAE